MSLWTKGIESIGWQDVLDFLDLRLSEGSRLDYKGELPANVEKHLAAFANTQGGHLLIGVEQDPSTGAPILPPKCVALHALDARIEQKGLEAIYPGFVPDVRLVEDPGRPGYGIAVVRVHESPQAPHAIQNSTRIYVRTGQHSMPEDLADLPRLERLLRRRSERELQRDHAIEAAQERTEVLYPAYTWSALAVSPLYPDAELTSPTAVLKWARERFKLRRFYPRAGGATSTEFLAPAQNEPRGRLDRHIEFSATGLTYFGASCDVESVAGGTHSLNLIHLTDGVARDLEDAALFLGWLGYHGHLRIHLTLHGAADIRLMWPSYPDQHPKGMPVEGSHVASATRLVDALTADDLPLQLINELRWSMGYGEFTQLDWFASVLREARNAQR